jgi:hypothetical protein
MLPKAFLYGLLLCLASAGASIAHAADSVGSILFAVRGVEIVRVDGSVENGAKGTELYQGDKVVTGEKGRAQIQFVDGARTALRPSTELVIETYAPTTANNDASLVVGGGGSAVLGLLKGGMRAVSGSITKDNPDAMSVKTPVATMGIRGTDFTAVLLPGRNGGFVLNVAVRDGIVRIFNQFGSIDVNAGEYASAESGIAPALRLRPPAGILGGDEDGDEGEGSDQSEGEGQQGADSGNASNSGNSQSPNESGEGGTEGTGEGSQAENDESDNQSSGDSLNNEQNAPISSGTQTSNEPPSPQNPPETTAGQNLETPQELASDGRTVSFSGIKNDNLPEIVLGQAVNDDAQAVIATDGSLREFVSQYSPFQTEGGGLQTTLSIVGVSVDTAQIRNKGADTATGFEWGRWAEGEFTANPGPDGNNETVTLSGEESVHWVYGLPVTGEPLANITASADYVLVGATEPTNDLGNAGVLGTANMFADFTEGFVALDLGLNIDGATWQASGTGDILNGGALPFSGSFLTGSVTGQACGQVTCEFDTGFYNGSFSPNIVDAGGNSVPAGAGFTYGLNGSIDGIERVVTGAAVVGNPTSQPQP